VPERFLVREGFRLDYPFGGGQAEEASVFQRKEVTVVSFDWRGEVDGRLSHWAEQG